MKSADAVCQELRAAASAEQLAAIGREIKVNAPSYTTTELAMIVDTVASLTGEPEVELPLYTPF